MTWFLGSRSRPRRRRQTVAHSTESAVRQRGTRPRAEHSRQGRLGSLESDETIRPAGSSQEPQHHARAPSARFVRPRRSKPCDSEVDRASRDLRESIPPNHIESSILNGMTEGGSLNTTKLRDHDGVREGIKCWLENRQNSERMLTPSLIANAAKDRVKGTDECKDCGKNGHWARDCRGPGGGVERRGKGDEGKRSVKGIGAAKKFDSSCRNCGRYGHISETCWATHSTKATKKGHRSKSKKGNQVNECS